MDRRNRSIYSNRPFKWLVFIFLITLTSSSWAQVKDINPNVQWKFVRSDSLPILEGATYQFKVPGNRGFDYILTFSHGTSNDSVYMEVFDMQGNPVAVYTGEGVNGTSDLHFDVEHNATYEIKVRIGSITSEDPEKYNTLLSLLKREKV